MGYNSVGDAMKIAYAGFDLMAPALGALCEENELVRLFTCAVDGVYETNTAVIALAQHFGAPYTTAPITPRDVDTLIADGCELLVSAGYYHRIPLDERLPMVNIHPSLLPYGRGAWPMPLAILDRLPVSGVTVHKTVERLDAGDILLQERFALDPRETLESFMARVNALLPDMMHRLTADFDRLWREARAQGAGEYQPQPDPEDYVLTSADSVAYADRVLRAFFGFPCFYRDDSGTTHTLLRADAVRGEGAGQPCPLADGYIRLREPFGAL